MVDADQDGPHLTIEAQLRRAGWSECGRGDWAIALRSPDGLVVARISPFDPAAPFAAELYRRGAATGVFPRLLEERALEGGGSVLVMERLHPVPLDDAVAFLARLRQGEPADAARVLREVHSEALTGLPWCGPVDDNPRNVLRGDDGRLKLTDPFFADGPSLYRAALEDPGLVAGRIPPDQRRFLLDLPLAESGPWDPVVREQMRSRLAAADAALGSR